MGILWVAAAFVYKIKKFESMPAEQEGSANSALCAKGGWEYYKAANGQRNSVPEKGALHQETGALHPEAGTVHPETSVLPRCSPLSLEARAALQRLEQEH